MLVERRLLEQLNGLDEDFFLYGEDLDLCYRMGQVGRTVVYYPESEIVHFGNPRWDDQRVERVYKALVTFYKKHLSAGQLTLLRTMMGISRYIRGVRPVMT
jgi:GT2 family glycosyltransferase